MAGRRRMSKKRESIELASLAPGTRVMFLLKENDDTPALFTEHGRARPERMAGNGSLGEV
ncbi:Electroneutral sodium bicarbonate exchanger 1 [Parelaphostrongylus tenuis]|uniref:Electroneutral sodium bicarbonate exchanger 1 n=1 Tax=Parelaphostrongylus tenuis TaxID=148309 RepID=A0AAD5WJW4_PARTN|nr:Electroneutral sodium bicarbonate exchanger 1 [Parelaphostrongylus tenuis]